MKNQISNFFSKQDNLENDLKEKINQEKINLQNFSKKMNLKDNCILELEKNLQEKIEEEKKHLKILNSYSNFTKSKFAKNKENLILFENENNMNIIDYKNLEDLTEQEKNILIWNKKRLLVKKHN